MPHFEEAMPRKDLPVFLILDTSKSMGYDGKIDVLNRTLREALEALQKEARKNADARIRVAVLEFNSGARWVTEKGLEELEEDFIWEDLTAGGLTDVGMALNELDAKLSRKAWLNSTTGSLMPVLIFMTDGQATDNYRKALDKIRENKWFEYGVKIGFAVGEDSDQDMIAEIVRNKEAVIQTNDLESFRKLLVFVTVRTSILHSQTKLNTDENNLAVEVVKEAAELLKETPAEDIIWSDDDFK